MLTTDQKQQLNDILEELGSSLDITKAEHEVIAGSYNAVAKWLAKPDSILRLYDPQILPQGSFMLGTMVHPVSDEDDLDIDLVCQLKRKPASWTQYSLKQTVGNQIRANETYAEMMDDEGRRCWTLKYANDKYHMDILPSFVDDAYSVLLEKAFSNIEEKDVDNLAIRITDNTSPNYRTDTNMDNWHKSNPFGYAKWFFYLATRPIELRRTFSLSESIKPIPSFREQKLPLQRVVQLLKRHRDIMFDGDEDKPISIIITTLAARAYNDAPGIGIADTLQSVASSLGHYIEDRNGVKWIANPVNHEENFADKWVENPKRKDNFYKWLTKIDKDFRGMHSTQQRGLSYLGESFKKLFGDTSATKAFSRYGEKTRLLRESGGLKMAATTGTLGLSGRTAVSGHNFFGTDTDE
jgi:hypothetical protein